MPILHPRHYQYGGIMKVNKYWSASNAIMTCGPHTGHAVIAIAFCKDEVTAGLIADALRKNDPTIPAPALQPIKFSVGDEVLLDGNGIYADTWQTIGSVDHNELTLGYFRIANGNTLINPLRVKKVRKDTLEYLAR
jgi:hypothetical protein